MDKPIKNAQDAYNTVARFIRHYTGDNADAAYKYCIATGMDKQLGRYADALDLILRVYYNIEDYAPDGVPMDQVWNDIENLAS